jgi:pimeloyl-ACP methyl ester carboxylesterase
MLYNTNLIDNIPSFIYSIKDKNYTTVINQVKQLLPRLSSINLAVYYSVMTADEGNFNKKKMLALDSGKAPVLIDGLSLFSVDPEIISSWPRNKINSNPISNALINIPTLLISGDFDPVTPPENATKIQKKLTNSQHFIFYNNGHVPLNNCFFELAKQFLNNPNQKLPSKCNNYTSFNWD